MTKLSQLTTYPCNKDKPFIFLSFTTCKRLDLFKQTINSILNHWGDYNKIEYWFCVDDNSSQQDRAFMQNTYPWIDYHMKTYSEKGHRQSMNIIWDKLNQLKPTYWIHMEDDFLFHRKYNYVESGIRCLQKYKDKNIKQVLFNRGYGETIKDYSITSYVPLDKDFSLHEHKQGHFKTRNCHYWPHYSFRPSIVDVESILKLGNYDSHNQFFEMDYANRWNDAGYKSAFFNSITNRHIGRLTSQRDNKKLPNAYELNNEGQFKRITPFIKIVNLKKRTDRKKSTIDKLTAVDCHSYTFITGVDGKTLSPTREIKKIFKKNDFQNHSGVIGCALSHYYLWKSLVDDDEHDFYLIMEDDFTLCSGFKEKIDILKSEMKNKEILFLGYHMFEKEREKVKEIYDYSSNNIQVSKLNSTYFVGGTFSYSINTKGAQLLIDYIEKNGIQHGIDYVLGKINNAICYETRPHLCFSLWDENDNPVDSDIKNNTRALDLTEPHIHIINLERRHDRKKKMIERFGENNITNYAFFKACDGTTIIPTHALKKIFEGNDFNNNPGAIGCAMSHLTLWKQLLQDVNNDFYLILEDDIEFADDYSKKFTQVCEFEQKDIIFLGYSMMEAERNKIDISGSTIQLNKLNKTRYIGGFFSYLINKKGAQKLVDYIDTNGIKHGIDYLIKIIDGLDCYEASPQLTFTKWNEGNITIDTDIQGFYTPIKFPKNDFIFIQGLDHHGNDLYYRKASLSQYFQLADKDEKCVGFNTLGFFKDKIDKFAPSPYFGKQDGLYIKKEYYEKYQAKQKRKSETHTIQKIYERDSHILNDVFIETGSFEGDGIQAALDIGFKEIHSIELSDKYYNICKERFKNFPQVHLHLGDSGTMLGHILSKINTGVTFWLDGHYSSTDTACAENYCSPVQQELQFIKQYNHPKHVILIDDMKDFTDKSIQWNLSTHKKCGYITKQDLEERLKEIHPNSKIYYFGPACVAYNKKYIKIKMLCNWLSSAQLCKKWSNMCEEGFRWKNIEITSEDDNIDYYVIINKPQKGAKFDPKKTIVFQMEPWVEDVGKNWGVRTWGEWANPNPNDFLAIRGRKTDCYNNVFWQLELNYNELKSLTYNEKLNTVSSICSSKYYDVGHKHRIDFLKFLEKKGDIELDIYNKDNKHAFKNYKGPLCPYIDKSKGIVPYKYYFMVENNYERNFITEKLWEPILCETLIFYYGCPNIKDYINEKAFVQLDMNDFEKSYEIIKKAIKEDWWSQRIDIIRAEKKKLLNEMGFFPVIEKIINEDIGTKQHNYCFIHSCTLPNKGTYRLEYLIEKIKKSKAINIFEKVFINNIGLPIDNNYGDKFEISNSSDDPKLYEIPTLNKIKRFSEDHPSCNILYLHNKGISYDDKNQYVNDWIDYMLYFMVERHTKCTKLLNNYNVIGCNYADKPYKHFSGNFWWANSTHLKRCSIISEINVNKMQGESWLMENVNNMSHYSLHQSNINHYHQRYPEKIYKHFVCKKELPKNNRKSKDNYKRIKMLCNWSSSEELCKKWSTMCDEDLHWKDIEITSEDENIDYYVIINKPQKGAKFDPKKTLIFQMEPWIYNVTKDWGVHTWAEWSIPDEKKFLYVGRHKNHLNAVQWEIRTPDIIPEERKNKALIFLSEKDFDWGHKKRIEFLKKLEDWQKGEEGRPSLIDVYGRENYHSLTQYKGPLQDDKKENHYINYKYCFAVENNSERNYATEKIWEPILCECLTFYWGCPGLEKHINEKAFVRLNITDFEGSLAIIQQAIKEDWWSQRIDIIRQEKQRIINELGFFPRLRKIISNKCSNFSTLY